MSTYKGIWRAALGSALGACVATGAPAFEVSTRIDPDTGRAIWTLRDGALSIELVQLLPDQTRAFSIGRGFPSESADRFARACVFQALIANVAAGGSGPALELDLRRWRVDAGQGAELFPLEATWQPHWEAAGLPQGARIAFRWALFPTEQTFMPGDHGWGMIPFGPAPDTRFDLSVVWDKDGAERMGRVSDLQCTPDRSISPAETTP